MSWQSSQAFLHGQRAGAGQRPVVGMAAAALLASQQGTAQAALAHMQAALQSTLNNIPADIHWPAFQAGLAKYAATPQQHVRPAYPELAKVGRVSLLDAGGTAENGACPVVLVPSMVNRGYILDLAPNFSLAEHLRNTGHRVLLLDWGDPTHSEDKPLTLENIIAERLEPLLQAAAKATGGPVAVVGYCMGGLLSVAAAVRLGPEIVGKLAVAAMPWDFAHTASHAHMQGAAAWLQPLLQASPILEPTAIAQYFWGLDPWSPIRRIMAYGTETDPARLHHLTLLEDWLADGLAIDSPVAHEILLGWYAENNVFKGNWVVQGTPILPQNLKMPVHVTLTQTDILVPLDASLPFIIQTSGATVHRAQTGHVSLVAGRRAKVQFYEPLTEWLTKV